MPTITISEDLDQQLQVAASEAGQTPDELAEALLRTHLEPEPELTPEQVSHLMRGVEQARRGELIPGEEVEKFLDEWQAELDAR